MKPSLRKLGVLLVLSVLSQSTACKKPDPVAQRLAQRNAYAVELTGWNWKGSSDSRTAMLNLNMMCGTDLPIGQLTILIEEIGPDSDAAIATRRHTLDVSVLDYDQPRPMLVTIENVNPEVDEGGFLVSVEHSPDPKEWDAFPELRDLPR